MFFRGGANFKAGLQTFSGLDVPIRTKLGHQMARSTIRTFCQDKEFEISDNGVLHDCSRKVDPPNMYKNLGPFLPEPEGPL